MNVKRPSPQKVSSKDVATAAGVSRTTVSFVLNNRDGIPEETRRRVWAAAKDLGYSPSPEARALRFGRSAVVLCLLPDWPITGPLGVLLEQLSENLAASGLTMLSHQRTGGDDLGQVLTALTPTAIVAMCNLSETEVQQAEDRGIALHAFMGRVPGRRDVAMLRQPDIGRLQVHTLASRGHASMAYVSPDERKLDWFSTPRLKGASKEARRLGVNLASYRMGDDSSPRDWLLSMVADDMTAICAYNDEVAFALLMCAQEAGLSVPDDVSLLGVDDSYIAHLTRPPLSSIGFNLPVEASRLTSLIVSDVKASRTSTHDMLMLRMRGSVRVVTGSS